MNTFSRAVLLSVVALSLPARAEEPAPAVGWFATESVRAMGIAQHTSFGLGLEAGVVLFKRLQVGVNLYGRSGDANDATFPTALPEGVTYKGRSTLDLRMDYGWQGLMVAPLLDMPGVSWLQLQVPLTVGYGGCGFYLPGEDRVTPDGRRVSEWEEELFNGADVGFAPMLDVGLRAAVALPGASWMQLGAGVHYTHFFGWSAYSRPPDFINGFSGSLFLTVGDL